MSGSPGRVLGLCGCLLAMLVALPAHADPFFVRVYGRTYKVDPRYPADEPKGPKPQEALKSLPSDLAKGPSFRPSHDEVLAEVEERLWIAKSQLDDALDKAAASRDGQKMGDSTRANGSTAIISIAESCSVAFMIPILAVMAEPARLANSSADTTGPSSRTSASATSVPNASAEPYRLSVS